MSTQVQDILSTAKAEVGNHEQYEGGHWVNDSKYTRWYGKIPGYNQDGYGYPWCAVYVTWVAHKAGHAGLYPKTAGCATAVNWFKRKNRFSFYPAIGAQVFFGRNGGTHTGIVYDYDDDYIYTYEGNTNANGSAEGDGVYKKKRARRDAYTYGYGYPEFAEGIKSADPDFKDEAPAKDPAPSKPAEPKPSKPSWDGKSFPGASAFKLGQTHPAVTKLGQRLVAHGYGRFYKEGPGPRFTEVDKDATQAFQKAQGWSGGDADGYPGPSTWSRLMAAPKKAAPKSTIVALNSAVKPGARHAQVAELQRLLLKAGYGPINGAVTTYYGTETQKAVARFHNKNPRLKSAGKSYDPAIGKQGFVELQKEAGRK